MFHQPALLNEAVNLLLGEVSGIYVDGTVGGGGHAELILERLSQDALLVGLDQDSDAIDNAKTRLQRFGTRVTLVKANFIEMKVVLAGLRITKINGMLLDLGVSSHQIDLAERGFSFSSNGQLDMRMNRERTLTAAAIVNSFTEPDLSALIKNFGEERRHRSIAHAIVKRRTRSPIRTTVELTEIIGAVLPPDHRVKSLARVFQALRIAVNEELQNLKTALVESLACIAPTGRLVVISYHSLEDRIVKEFFKNESARCVCPPELPMCVCDGKGRLKILTKRPIRPTHQEVQRNPRSRSARLRAAEAL
ncbi:MAG TPA: 16S rRNA (cytosine(1402)-N(4))-methyltransferase RsmH [bacterium]